MRSRKTNTPAVAACIHKRLVSDPVEETREILLPESMIRGCRSRSPRLFRSRVSALNPLNRLVGMIDMARHG